MQRSAASWYSAPSIESTQSSTTTAVISTHELVLTPVGFPSSQLQRPLQQDRSGSSYTAEALRPTRRSDGRADDLQCLPARHDPPERPFDTLQRRMVKLSAIHGIDAI